MTLSHVSTSAGEGSVAAFPSPGNIGCTLEHLLQVTAAADVLVILGHEVFSRHVKTSPGCMSVLKVLGLVKYSSLLTSHGMTYEKAVRSSEAELSQLGLPLGEVNSSTCLIHGHHTQHPYTACCRGVKCCIPYGLCAYRTKEEDTTVCKENTPRSKVRHIHPHNMRIQHCVCEQSAMS